ncbi:MAG: hypothetical protein ACOCWR_04610, partial [Oceanidesulfovibrio sp.]
MTTRLALSTLAIATALLLCSRAATPAAAYSGDAGSGFRYEEFELTDDRELTGFIVNSRNTIRRNVRVTITAIGEASGAPLWSTRLNLGTMSPGERKPLNAAYGRFTADPGSFTFEFTEERQPEPQQPEAETEAPEEPQAEEAPLQDENACSSIENTLRGKEVLGNGECTSVPFTLAKG